MNLLNFDQLIYPVLMTIRQLKDVQQSKFKQEILECQNRVEDLVLCLMKFTLDYILDGPDKVQINYQQQRHQLKIDLRLQLEQLQIFLSKKEFNFVKNSIRNQIQNPEGFSETSSDNEQESFQMKLTGQIKLFNPEIQKLNYVIKELKDKLNQYESKEIRRRNSIDQLAAAHIKEVSILKQQLRKQSQDENEEEYIEAVYFDKTSTLEPEVQEMMNEKIKNIKQQYERYVQQFMTRKKSQQIEQPQIIKIKPELEDYSPLELVKMLLEKEQNAYKIWKIFEDCRSFRFLLSVITNQEQSYGISYKEINEVLRCSRQELKKIEDLKQQLQHDQSWIAAQFAYQIQQHKNQINQFQKQIEELIEKQTKQILSITQSNNIPVEINQLIIDKSSLITTLEQQNKSLQQQLSIITLSNNQNKKYLEYLLKNMKSILHILDEKGQSFSQIIQFDWEKSKPIIIANLLQMIQKIDPFIIVSFSTQISSLLFQINLTKLVENSEITPISNSTQTEDNYTDYIVIREPFPQQIQKKETEHKFTQTFQLSSQRRITKTENIQETQNKTQNQSFKLKIESDVYDRLFETAAKFNQKIKQIKPFIEQMQDKEFSDLLQILNSLQFEKSSQQFYIEPTSNSNQIIKLPQDNDFKFNQTQRSQQFIFNSMRQSKQNKIIKKPSRSVDLKSAQQQANELFSDLDRQRKKAQTQYYKTKMTLIQRKIPQLIPNTEKIKQLKLNPFN